MDKPTITLTIDGVKIQAQKGQTVIQAANAAGIFIPQLCYHKDLSPGGHCRQCTVKINGKHASACTFPASDGMVIENNTDDLNAMRKRLIELLFVEGNHYCPACEEGGQCELQALAYRYGIAAPRYPYLNRKRELDATHDDVYLDRNRCVLCGRCVRASAEVDKKKVFKFENRGHDQRIGVNGTEGLGSTNLEATDKAVEVCPTGALIKKRVGFEVPLGQRTYDLEPIGADINKD
jgi:[NiFe] hydrogenase diaphorase moiety small subunit